MSIFDKTPRSTEDLSAALSTMLKPLRSTAGFANAIIIENELKLDKSALQNLAAIYRGRSIESTVSQMVSQLRKLHSKALSKDDAAALESLLKKSCLNFHKTANTLRGTYATANSVSSKSKRGRVISAAVDDLPGFKTCGDEAIQVLDRIRKIVKKYVQDSQHRHKNTSAVPKRAGRSEYTSDTARATKGSI